jgi:ubiquitin-protein ligase
MLTPVFHPNIAPHAVCIGDHWSPGESLAALILRIGEMITFQSYNTKSPLNGAAARWAEENIAQLPIQRIDLSLPSTEQ